MLAVMHIHDILARRGCNWGYCFLHQTDFSLSIIIQFSSKTELLSILWQCNIYLFIHGSGDHINEHILSFLFIIIFVRTILWLSDTTVRNEELLILWRQIQSIWSVDKEAWQSTTGWLKFVNNDCADSSRFVQDDEVEVGWTEEGTWAVMFDDLLFRLGWRLPSDVSDTVDQAESSISSLCQPLVRFDLL